LTFLGVLLGTVAAAFLVSSFHEASMEILVNNERLDPILTPESTQTAAAPSPVTDSKVNSEIELLNSPDLLEKVVIANDLDDVERKSLISRIIHGKQSDTWYVARAVKHLGAQLDIKLVTKSSMIQVKYGSVNPQRAYKVLNTLGNLYLEKHLAV